MEFGAQEYLEPGGFGRFSDGHTDAAARKRVHLRRRMSLVQVVCYAVDAAVLALFALAGTTSFGVAAAFLASGLAITGLSTVSSESRFNDRFRNHHMTVPIASAGALVQFAFLYAAPEVGIVFIGALFVLFTFAMLRFSATEAVVGWVITTLCLAALMLFTDKSFAIPLATPAERAITLLALSLSIGRCAYAGLFGNAMRKILYERSNELTQANKRIEELAEIDELTGAFNRRSLIRSLDEECVRVQRTGSPFSVALIDLDHFKRINDRFGHPVGDEVLRTFAITMFANIRACDRFGRYGGEEFLLLMPDTAPETATLLLDRLRIITADVDWNSYSDGLTVTMSAGVAALRPNEAPEALLTRADAALYRSKDQGRNKITTT